MQLLHVKMNNGEDLLGYGTISEDKKSVHIEHPISVKVDPSLGIYAVKWLYFSENNKVSIPSVKIMFVDKASKLAIECYEDFVYKHGEREMSEDELKESANELEEMFLNMIESKASTKH